MNYEVLKARSPFIYNLALKNRESCNNTNIPRDNTQLITSSTNGNFNWGKSPQGYDFWLLVDDGKFEEAYKILKIKKKDLIDNFSII